MQNNGKIGKLKTAGILATGALIFIGIAFLIWTLFNFDVLVKAIKYPEAVRQLNIEVKVAQFAK